MVRVWVWVKVKIGVGFVFGSLVFGIFFRWISVVFGNYHNPEGGATIIEGIWSGRVSLSLT